MIRLGIDPHKEKHIAVICDQVAREIAHSSTKANTQGYRELLEWSKQYCDERLWGIENPQSYGRGLAQFLVTNGEKVLAVPSQLTGEYRKKSSRKTKTDLNDALAVARALLQEEENLLPVLKENNIQELNALMEHYDNLRKEQTQQINRLHAQLMNLVEDYLQVGKLTSKKVIQYWLNQAQSYFKAGWQIVKSLCLRILQLTDEMKELTKQFEAMLKELKPEPLLQIEGIGKFLATKLIALTGNTALFKSEAAFANYAGVAPISNSSGKREIHMVNPGGNRKLNNALHQIMITQLGCYEKAKNYYQKKISEGKTPREAKRCLKRQIARRVFKALLDVDAIKAA
jgi:transposase